MGAITEPNEEPRRVEILPAQEPAPHTAPAEPSPQPVKEPQPV